MREGPLTEGGRHRSGNATGHQRDTEISAAPLPVSDDRQGCRDGAEQAIVAIKNVSINEAYFQGHFPGKPVMPGVLILESMAQAGGLLLLQEIPDRDHKLLYLASMNDVKFRRPVLPGDQLRVEVDILAWKGDLCKIQAKAFVDGNLATEATLMCVMVDRDRANNAGK